MSRITTASIFRSTISTRFASSHLSRKEPHPLAVCNQQTKYGRQAETSILCLDTSLDVVSRRDPKPLTSLGSKLHSRWSIHHPDSWNWTSADVRWLINPACQRKI